MRLKPFSRFGILAGKTVLRNLLAQIMDVVTEKRRTNVFFNKSLSSSEVGGHAVFCLSGLEVFK